MIVWWCGPLIFLGMRRMQIFMLDRWEINVPILLFCFLGASPDWEGLHDEKYSFWNKLLSSSCVSDFPVSKIFKLFFT